MGIVKCRSQESTHGHFNQVAFAVIQVYFSGIATIALVSKS